MGLQGPRLLRKTTNVVLDALLHTVENACGTHPLSPQTLHGIVESLKASDQFDEFYRRAYREILETVEDQKQEQKRQDAFGRLMIHPLSPLLQNGILDRDIIPNIFQFLHLVLGEAVETFSALCLERVKTLRENLHEDFTWDDFYADDQCKLVQWQALVRIAGSFKRWDVRQDWFIKLMQYQPTSVSIGQSAFVMRDTERHEQHHLFGKREFCQLFRALFVPLTQMDRHDEELFRNEFGEDPHHLIGNFLIHLSSCEV